MTAPSAPLAQRPAAGIALRLAAMLTLAGMWAVVKLCAERGAPVLQIVFFRNAVGLIPVCLYVARSGGWSVLKTQRPWGHLTRASIGITGLVCGFMAVSRLPLTESTAIGFAAPLFMTALSALILKEQVGVHRWGAVAVGFVGVLIMCRPDPARVPLVGALFALGNAFGSAGAMIAIRQIADTERGPTIVFYFTLSGAVFGAACLPFVWVTPDPTTLGLLILAGLFGGVGQLFLTGALRLASVAVIAPIDYTQLIWASALGFLIWGELPNAVTVAGAAVVAVSGLYIVFRETRRARATVPPMEDAAQL